MKKYFIITTFILLLHQAYSQDCSKWVAVSSTDHTRTISKGLFEITNYNKMNIYMAMDAILENKELLTINLTVMQNSKNFNAPNASKISFLLADDSTIDLQNESDDSYFQESVSFKGTPVDKKKLLRLSSVDVKQISVWNKTTSLNFIFTKEQSDNFKNIIRCLSNSLQNVPAEN